MNTQADVRSIFKLVGGCLFCLGVAALGFYPFADHKRRRDRLNEAYARDGMKALLS